MKFLIVTASVFALATGAIAQTVTANPGANSEAAATETNDTARARVQGEAALARAITGPVSAVAQVGDAIIARSLGNGPGPGNAAAAEVSSGGPGNRAVQFQIGVGNSSMNMQVGDEQESATLQIGDNNNALISQTNFANEAAISQTGNSNNAIVVQDGEDNGAAVAQLGTNNNALGLQSGGPDNYLAIASIGENNTATTFQQGDRNTAASLQEGSDNVSFISQGAGLAFSLTDVAGDVQGGGLGAGVFTIGSTALGSGSSRNSAASLQDGTNNQSAILQFGSDNSAVNYQAN